MPASEDQIRITVWLDRDLYLKFQMLHPQQGATSAFVRRWFSNYVKGVDKRLDNLLEEKTP